MSKQDIQDGEQLPDELLDAAREAMAQMERLQRLALTEAGISPKEAMPTHLKLAWQAGMSAEDLAGAAFHSAQKVASDRAPLQKGQLYCYRCADANCEHSTPQDREDVFAGYENNGTPRWQTLTNHLLELEDDRIDRLYGERPAVLARVVGRKRIIADQFTAYGRNSLTYRILGQVVAGLYTIGGHRHAITVQVVETADHALHTQTLAHPAMLQAMRDAGDDTRSRLYRLYDARRQLERSVRETSGSWQGCLDRQQRGQLRARLFQSLRHFAGSLERHRRQGDRRTEHAKERARQQRPVAKAVEDVNAASPADFYRDRKTQSVVIVGRRGRSHVFSSDGRHITSLALAGDVLERRKARRRYVPLAAEEREAFRRALTPTEND